MVANFKYKIMIYWQDVNIIFDYPINPRKVNMYENIIYIPRNGYRARSLGIKKSLCYGSEWPRRANFVFYGKLDLGGLRGE